MAVGPEEVVVVPSGPPGHPSRPGVGGPLSTSARAPEDALVQTTSFVTVGSCAEGQVGRGVSMGGEYRPESPRGGDTMSQPAQGTVSEWTLEQIYVKGSLRLRPYPTPGS